MTELYQPQFWLVVIQIMWINILLSGDNAVVIALACRNLPPRERLWGMVFGAGVAVALRIVFTGVVAYLMRLPYLKLIGGLALLWIAAKLVVPEPEDEEGSVEAVQDLWRAVRIVAVADIIMSLDNVVAIAAIAKDSYPLLILGLGISIPLIIAGAAIITAMLDRLPIIVWAGAALLGWIAGQLVITDPAIAPHVNVTAMVGADINSVILGSSGRHRADFVLDLAEIAAGSLGALAVVVAGWLWLRARQASAMELRLEGEQPPPAEAPRPIVDRRQPAQDKI